MPVKVNALDHIVINVNDVARSAEWYRTILGMEVRVFDPGPGKTPRTSISATIRITAITAPGLAPSRSSRAKNGSRSGSWLGASRPPLNVPSPHVRSASSISGSTSSGANPHG